MSLAPGTRLGPYEILAPLGAGGMGEVYTARDTRLNREVAVKVSGERFTDRFEREARSIAALNHPNICTLHDVGPNYLVMELVEGPTLVDRIREGPIALDEALLIAHQIADALEAAHERGIVHRDLKPGNIKVKPDGTVKVLDFGLAKIADPTSAERSPESSPTITLATHAGMILGTAAYMAPEQARGLAVDKRADIWAFGVVLYEMLTGRRLFEGATTTEILSEVLTKEPEWGRVPVKVQRLLRSCLEKDLKNRLRDIGDAWRHLDEVPQVVDRSGRRLITALAVALAGTMLASAFLYFYRAPEKTRLFKFAVLAPGRAAFYWSFPSISPDGRHLAFVAVTEGNALLWVRDLDSLAARPLSGTEGAFAPFWSPDSRFIAFFSGDKLKKIEVAGGPSLSLCDAPGGRLGSWSKRNVILFSFDRSSLLRVPAAGGSSAPLTALDPALGEISHIWPWFLPDGRHFLFTASSADPEKTAVYVGDLDSKTRRRILTVNSMAVYAPPGYLLFLRERALMAQPFDASKAQITGDPVPIAEQIEYHSWNGFGFFSASQNGILAYSSGIAWNQQLTWFDRSGKAVGTVGPPGIVTGPEVSPDGNTVAVERQDTSTAFHDIWLHDLKRGTTSRFTFNSKNNLSPEWSPDGSHIAFSSDRDGVMNLYQKTTSTAAQEELLDKSLYNKFANDWSRDGRYIIVRVYDPKTKNDIWVLPRFGDRKPFPYLRTEFNEGNAKLSPDGRWLAYDSDETGRPEIYVQNFPTHGGKWQVSSNGGELPTWSRDGRELFFNGAGRTLMVAEVKEGAKFEASVPKALFDMPNAGYAGPSNRAVGYSVSNDGRFLMPIPVEQPGSVPMTVVVNWTAELKK